MREPAFWQRPSSLAAAALWPISKIYGEIAAARMTRAGVDAGVPVICVGNFHLGGAGKTPTVLALIDILRDLGETPVVLSRGYGGRLQGPVLVDPARHGAKDVGDEPLMMAAHVPVVVSRERVEGAVLARARNASVIVMDDGFQNPSLVKHLSLIVVDAARGLGNGHVFPAGPLRAPLDRQWERADALVVIGHGNAADTLIAQADSRPVFRARLVPDAQSVAALSGQRVMAFAGIADPDKFFRSLSEAGVDVAETRSFADHHVFSPNETAALRADAVRQSLSLVTTEKDRARLGADGADIQTLKVGLQFDEFDKLRGFLVDRTEEVRLARRSRI